MDITIKWKDASIMGQVIKTSLHMVALIFVLNIAQSDSFSTGSLLVSGNTVARQMYCHRPVLHRPPIHMEESCGGVCAPRMGSDVYSIDLHVNDSTYWINGFQVSIRAKTNSGYSVTGFSLVAVDRMRRVVGIFTGNDGEVVAGTCDSVVHKAVEGQFIVHAKAQHGRNNVTVTWTPDGYNHETVKFHAWIVHNHSHIFYLESEEITSQKDGDTTLDVDAIFRELMGSALTNMNQFESTFVDRQTQGYHTELDDPFKPFNEGPSQQDLVPGFGKPTAERNSGWWDNSANMLRAIDNGGVYSWTDMIEPEMPNRGSSSLLLRSLLGGKAFESGLININIGRKSSSRNDEVAPEKPKEEANNTISNKPKETLNETSSTVGNQDKEGNDNTETKPLKDGNLNTSLETIDTSNTTENFIEMPLANGTRNITNIDDENMQTPSNISGATNEGEIVDKSENTTKVQILHENIPKVVDDITHSRSTMEEPSKGSSASKNTTETNSGFMDLNTTLTYPDVNETLGENSTNERIARNNDNKQNFNQGISKSETKTLLTRANRIRRQASRTPTTRSSSRSSSSPPAWAMGPQMAFPSTRPLAPPPRSSSSSNSILGLPMPTQSSSARGRGNPRFPSGSRPRTMTLPAGVQPVRAPSSMGMPPFGSQGQNPFGQSNQNPFGQSSQNPFGQPSQNPFGQPNQNPFGQPSQNPFGQTNQNPFGQTGQNPFGQSSPNSFGQSNNPFPQMNQNAFRQPGQNPFGQQSQNPFGQPGQNPFGQPNQNPFRQQNQNPFGQINQNPFGQQNQQSFGQPNPNPFGQPNQSTFGQANQNPFGPPNQNPFNQPSQPGQGNQDPFSQSNFPGPQPMGMAGQTQRSIGGPPVTGDPTAIESDPTSEEPKIIFQHDEELELRPSPFESMNFNPFEGGGQSPFGNPSTSRNQMTDPRFGQPFHLQSGGQFSQMQNPFSRQTTGMPGSSSNSPFGGPQQLPGFPGLQGGFGSMPGMPSQYGQNRFGSSQSNSMNPFMSSSQFANPFMMGGNRNSGSNKFGSPFGSRPSSSFSPFGLSSMPSPRDPFQGMRNPLSMSQGGRPGSFSNQFSSMRQGFPNMMAMGGMPGMMPGRPSSSRSRGFPRGPSGPPRR